MKDTSPSEIHITHRDFPSFVQLGFEVLIFLHTAGHRKEVINMHDSYDSATAHGAIVNAVLTQEVNEAPALHRIVHGYVPNTASLLHAVECFEELPNMVNPVGCSIQQALSAESSP